MTHLEVTSGMPAFVPDGCFGKQTGCLRSEFRGWDSFLHQTLSHLIFLSFSTNPRGVPFSRPWIMLCSNPDGLTFSMFCRLLNSNPDGAIFWRPGRLLYSGFLCWPLKSSQFNLLFCILSRKSNSAVLGSPCLGGHICVCWFSLYTYMHFSVSMPCCLLFSCYSTFALQDFRFQVPGKKSVCVQGKQWF